LVKIMLLKWIIKESHNSKHHWLFCTVTDTCILKSGRRSRWMSISFGMCKQMQWPLQLGAIRQYTQMTNSCEYVCMQTNCQVPYNVEIKVNVSLSWTLISGISDNQHLPVAISGAALVHVTL
jgi:hypothetical protein